MEIKEWQVRMAVNNVVSNWKFLKYYISPRYYFQNLLVQEIERVSRKKFSEDYNEKIQKQTSRD